MNPRPSRNWPLAVTVAAVVLVLVGAPAVLTGSPSSDEAEPPRERGLLPGPCERRVGDLYETVGPAAIEKLGARYALTVCCPAVNQIYVRGSAAPGLDSHVGKPVRVRYRYVDEPNPHTRCVRAPCPPAVERVVDITAVEELTGATPAPPLCR